MPPIDQPFRFTRGFCAVWMLLGLAAFFFNRQHHFDGPWYSCAVFLVLASLLAAFLLYGPVLLARQAMHSGTRGRVVVRTSAIVVCAAGLIFGGLYFSGYYSEFRAQLLASVFSFAAAAYLSWRLGT